MKIIKLHPIDRRGFLVDTNFLERVKKHIRSNKKKAVIDEALCAIVIAEFLATYEIKQREIN